MYGQNILNWRNRTQTHDNIPPSTNVWTVYLAKDDDAIKPTATSLSYSGRASLEEGRREVDGTDRISFVEAQYLSSVVSGLEEFESENLTYHDYVLRILPPSDEQQEPALMKQSI